MDDKLKLFLEKINLTYHPLLTTPELIDGYLCQNIYEYLNFLKSSNREKDKLRIPIVEEYIDNLKNNSIKKVTN